MCIAPAALVAIFTGSDVRLSPTIGNDPETAQAIEACGARHVACVAAGIVVNRVHRVVTTPAYMRGPGIDVVARGIETRVDTVVDRTQRPDSNG